jgi:transcriptional regulator with XRE-family HTH domain
MEVNNMTIGERIKARRKEIHMSADELGKILGKDRSTIFRYEKGEIENLPLDILEPIADALDVTPAYLMGWEPETSAPGMTLYLEEYRNKLYVDEIMGYIEKLNDAGKAEAVQRVKELTFIPRYVAVEEPVLNAAHERTDIEVTEAMRKHDEDIMDDDNF